MNRRAIHDDSDSRRLAGRGRSSQPVILWLMVVAVVVSSCTGPAATEVASGVEFIGDRKLDVIAPSERSELLPGVVLLHGAGLERDAYRDLADAIAARGAVVFIADWRVLPSMQNGGLEDAACVVRYARSHAGEYLVDPGKIVLVAHSTGGVFAGRIATDGDSFRGECPETGTALPDALVIISPAQVPGGPPWPHNSIGGNDEMPVAVIHGVDDEVVSPRLSDRTAAVLRDAGYPVTLLKVPGGHLEVVMVDSADGEPLDAAAKRTYAEPVIDEILAIADRIDR